MDQPVFLRPAPTLPVEAPAAASCSGEAAQLMGAASIQTGVRHDVR